MSPKINPAVSGIIVGWQDPVRHAALEVRGLIYATASRYRQVGRLSEMLKWNQPAYLTEQSGSGTTIRLGETREGTRLGLYVHCQTSLIDTFRSHYPDEFEYEKNRGIILHPDFLYSQEQLSHCIALALTYHDSKIAL